MMFPSIAFTLSAMLVAYASGAPLETNDAGSAIEARSGWRTANVYSNLGCSGFTVTSVSGFKCGGTCHQFGRGSSILLQQENSGSPVPTASLFQSNTCSGAHQSVGISSGQNSGCSNAPSAGVWGSMYLYYNC